MRGTTAVASHPEPVRAGPRVLAGLAAAVAGLALIGWIFDVPGLTRLSPHLSSMKFNTAVAVVLLAASWQTARQRIAVALASVTGLIAVVTLLEYAVNHSLGIDQLFVADTRSTVSGAGRMAIASAVSLGLLAGCRVLIATARPRWVPTAAAAVIVAAIQELRVTIFSLKTMTASPNAFARLRACVDDAARVLGFAPAFAATGDPAYLTEPILGTVEGALREALSNVVRHAKADSASVDISIDETSLTVVIADDGIGFDPAGVRHASGTTNIRRRAESLGGSAIWTQSAPHGTTLTWRVRTGAEPNG
jgi:hypothetical protein